MRLSNWKAGLGIVCLLLASVSCSTTQKTPGGGLTSAVAQNVVRIACVEAIRGADLSWVAGKQVYLTLTGFADEKNRGILEHLFMSKMEEAGAKLVSEDRAQIEVEIATMTAGNDAGKSSFPLISHSERVEGIVDVQMTIRDVTEGKAIMHTQPLHGMAKYQQDTFIGFQGRGTYYVKTPEGKFRKIDDPSSYR